MKMLFTLIFVTGLSHAATTRDFDPATLKWDTDTYSVDRREANRDPFTALKKLIGGNKRFVEGKSTRPRQDFQTLKETAKGQEPFAVIVGCSDSRVPNEIIFDQGLGDLFIIRTAGQVSAAASYASMEFATTALKSKLIVVLGHTECGAVAAAVNPPKNAPGHISTLINEIKPAAKACKDQPGNHVANTVRQNVIEQVNKLRELEPTLAELYRTGKILIVGAVYDLSTGKVDYLPETLKSLPVSK